MYAMSGSNSGTVRIDAMNAPRPKSLSVLLPPMNIKRAEMNGMQIRRIIIDAIMDKLNTSYQDQDRY